MSPSRTILIALSTLFVVVLGFDLDAGGNGGDPVKGLSQDIREGRVASIKIFAMPYDLRTRARVTPEILRQTAASREVDLTENLAASLLGALDATQTSPTTSDIDCRWGLILRDESGLERHAIYLSGRSIFRAGRHGLIDEHAIELNGPLVEWLERNFRWLQADK